MCGGPGIVERAGQGQAWGVHRLGLEGDWMRVSMGQGYRHYAMPRGCQTELRARPSSGRAQGRKSHT